MEHVQAPKLRIYERQRNNNPISEVDQQSTDITTNAAVDSNENAPDTIKPSPEPHGDEDQEDGGLFDLEDVEDAVDDVFARLNSKNSICWHHPTVYRSSEIEKCRLDIDEDFIQ